MTAGEKPTGPLGGALDILREWDPEWAEQYRRVAANPWESGVLPPATVELVALAASAACTNLESECVRRHAAGALAAGASRDQVLEVIKMAALLAIHSCSVAAPILLGEAAAAGASAAAGGAPPPTPVCDAMKAAGGWNEVWNPFFALDPEWTEAFMAAGAPVYGGKVFDPKLAELLSVAFDASITHLYAPGIRRHIKAALAHGATPREIMEVLKLCVASGAAAINLAMPILEEVAGTV